jgi:murein DD-endopeptidase MepM/ murein hydrolase activator NlpD
MQGNPNSVFQCDLKYLVDSDPPHRRGHPRRHAHWLASSVIAIAVGIWIGSDPAASIGDRQSVVLDPTRPVAASLVPLSLRGAFDSPARIGASSPHSAPRSDAGAPPGDVSVRQATDTQARPLLATEPAPSTPPITPAAIATEDIQVALAGPAKGDHEAGVAGPAADTGPTIDELRSAAALNWWSDDEPWLQDGLESFETDFSPQPSPPLAPFQLELDYRIGVSSLPAPSGPVWLTIDIQTGDTLTKLFKRHGLDPAIAASLSRTDDARALNHLATGPRLRIRPGDDGMLEALEYDLDQTRVLSIVRTEGDDYRIETVERQVEIRHVEVAGTIESSLFQAGNDAGLSDQLIYRLASIFKYDIDFSRDLQPGDSFSVIYEEKHVDGEKIGTGPVLAANFTISGKDHRAIRHVDKDGSDLYYTPEGESLRTPFLRSPVQFTRISSYFSKRRYHPVLKKWRAHTGVDYAARPGTPVVATADGVVEYVGRKGGYGKTVILTHGEQYSTLYAHLSGYGKSMAGGKRVRQGQIIGYVGSTGLATGPHLHYEFRVGGSHRDPLAVDLPRSLPIDSDERKSFVADARQWSARLDRIENR